MPAHRFAYKELSDFVSSPTTLSAEAFQSQYPNIAIDPGTIGALFPPTDGDTSFEELVCIGLDPNAPDQIPGARSVCVAGLGVRAFLESVAKRRILFTYQELAKALQILPPHSIHQVTEALERLMEEDAAADRPFIAALAISKTRGGLPAPGFFDCARRLGRFAGPRSGCKDVSRRRAERRLCSLGRFAQQLATRTSCSPN